MKSERRKQIMTLSILVVSILVISIGFAAFSSTLRISSTANVNPNSSDFKVVFSNKSDSIDEGDVVPTNIPDTISASDGVIDNTTSPTLTGLQANFTAPGQKAVYNLYVYNAGKYIAYLNSVTLKGNKTCTPGEGASISLVGQACEDIIVSVKLGNDVYKETTTGITGKSIGIGQSIPIEITIEYLENGAVADGPFSVEFNDISLYYATVSGENEEYNGESGTLYTGEIYRNSPAILSIGDSIKYNQWCAVVPGVANSCVENEYYNEVFKSKEACEETLEQIANSEELDATTQYLIANAVCQQGETYTYEYETNLSNISQNYYLKHDIVNNVVTASYACGTYTENGVRKDVCLRGTEPSSYSSNQAILRSVEPYFNTLDYNNSYNNYKGYCSFSASDSDCYSDSLHLYAGSGGGVLADGGTLSCDVNSDGYSGCYE